MINTEILIKDNAHNDFAFTKHLQCSVAHIHILILLCRWRLIGLLRVTTWKSAGQSQMTCHGPCDWNVGWKVLFPQLQTIDDQVAWATSWRLVLLPNGHQMIHYQLSHTHAPLLSLYLLSPLFPDTVYIIRCWNNLYLPVQAFGKHLFPLFSQWDVYGQNELHSSEGLQFHHPLAADTSVARHECSDNSSSWTV